MSGFSSSTFYPPKDWQQFERNIRLLFEHSLADPHTQNNGRQGQPQQGVDVYGRRGGKSGVMVGVQCKGKDANFGEPVTEKELREEVKKSEDFKPDLKEFFLVTTAQDDGKIQEVARLLQDEVKKQGRDLSISVWGWGRLEEEIKRFPEVIRAFQPDAMPYGDRLFNELADIKATIQKQADAGVHGTTGENALSSIVNAAPPQIASDSGPQPDALDQFLHNQIDTYRNYLRDGRPKTAIDLLSKLKEQVWTGASDRIRFRILGNLGAAEHRLGNYKVAAELFLEAALFRPDDPVSIANKIAALLIKGDTSEARSLAADAFKRFPENADIAMQRLQAGGENEDVEDIWLQLPVEVRNKPEFIIQRVTALRAQGDPKAQSALEDGIQLHPDDVKLKALRAEGILERLIKNDASAIGLDASPIPSQADLIVAAEGFEAMWNSTLGHETAPEVSFAHNAALSRASHSRLPGRSSEKPRTASPTYALAVPSE